MTSARQIGAALLLVWTAACARPRAPFPEPQQIGPPDVADVESILFLVGDAGEATMANSPLLNRLRADVEWWSENLDRDSAAVVLYLGDIVYPLGINPPGSSEFPHDSLIVMGQVDAVSGPAAVSRGTRAYFLAGNHDWGLEEEWNGFVRLQGLADFLNRARAVNGAAVQVAPDPGTGGPYTFDLGQHARLLLLDTAWWVLDGGQLGIDDRPAVLEAISQGLATAGDRHVLIAAHHPFRSGGPHGGEFSFWRTLGIRYLLTRSGAMLQDLTSVPYREFESGLRSIFASTRPPLAFLGGHEHSLQVFESIQPTDPAFSVVSGAASKLSSIGVQPGMSFGMSAPGYMRLIIEKDGGAALYVEAAPEQYLACSGSPEQVAGCISEGVAAFRVVHSQRME